MRRGSAVLEFCLVGGLLLVLLLGIYQLGRVLSVRGTLESAAFMAVNLVQLSPEAFSEAVSLLEMELSGSALGGEGVSPPEVIRRRFPFH